MTQEEKELLLRDLCARFPFGVSVKWKTARNPAFVKRIDDEKIIIYREYSDYIHAWECCIEDIKPYLRPMSNMTNEERLIYEQRLHDVGRSVDVIDADDVVSHIDWLNKNKFDYRGLIGKGLAIEAPEGMYKKIKKYDNYRSNH